MSVEDCTQLCRRTTTALSDNAFLQVSLLHRKLSIFEGENEGTEERTDKSLLCTVAKRSRDRVPMVHQASTVAAFSEGMKCSFKA